MMCKNIIIAGAIICLASFTCVAMQPDNDQPSPLVELFNHNQLPGHIISSYLSVDDHYNVHLAAKALRTAWDPTREIDTYERQLPQVIAFLKCMNASNPINCQICADTDNKPIQQSTIDQIAKYPNVQGLHIIVTFLISFPRQLMGLFPHLKKLNVSHCQFNTEVIALICKQFPELEELDLSSNSLLQLPAQIGQLKRLKKINLSDNRLTSEDIIPLFECTELEQINLSNNKLDAVPANIKELKKLRELNVSGNLLAAETINTLSECTQLTRLNLSGNKISHLPVQMGRLTHLEAFVFYWSDVTLDTIAQICELFPQLKELNLSGNHLSQLPIQIHLLTKLKRLALCSNNFTTNAIAQICQSCPQLEELNLSRNKLTRLPPEMSLLQHLKIINLMQCGLTRDGLIPLCACSELEKLDLTGNELYGLPEEMGKLIRLKEIILTTNNLTGPATIPLYNCTQLEKIDISHNKLSGVPEEIRNLLLLKNLHLSMNQLTDQSIIPLFDCTQLEVLDLCTNYAITTLPPQIHQLTRLRHYLGPCSLSPHEKEKVRRWFARARLFANGFN